MFSLIHNIFLCKAYHDNLFVGLAQNVDALCSGHLNILLVVLMFNVAL